jgi:hypothetical protein
MQMPTLFPSSPILLLPQALLEALRIKSSRLHAAAAAGSGDDCKLVAERRRILESAQSAGGRRRRKRRERKNNNQNINGEGDNSA